MIVIYLEWRLVNIYLGIGYNAKPASHEIRDISYKINIITIIAFIAIG